MGGGGAGPFCSVKEGIVPFGAIGGPPLFSASPKNGLGRLGNLPGGACSGFDPRCGVVAAVGPVWTVEVARVFCGMPKNGADGIGGFPRGGNDGGLLLVVDKRAWPFGPMIEGGTVPFSVPFGGR
jgi:hypothetical protein